MFRAFHSLFLIRGELVSFTVLLTCHDILPCIIKGDGQHLPAVFVQNAEVVFPVPAGLNVFLKSGARERPELFKSVDHLLTRRSGRRVANLPDVLQRIRQVR
ncbi:hypothetical protein VL10_23470 [Leclercia adecarboxylata]|nr:hypothetical protein VL10_23470 [Leclercia adecarboxylata]KMN59345.1 hypothetical protein VK95_24570 [Leclercia sp. LK8]